MIFTLRRRIGAWLYFMGYRIMPPAVRQNISIINKIGLKWVEHGCPRSFEIEIEK